MQDFFHEEILLFNPDGYIVRSIQMNNFNLILVFRFGPKIHLEIASSTEHCHAIVYWINRLIDGLLNAPK